jgi:hypothetical protein
MAITSAVTDLFASIYELLASFLGAVYTIVHSFVMGIFNLFAGFLAFFGDIFQGVFDIVGGVGKFVAGEFYFVPFFLFFFPPAWLGGGENESGMRVRCAWGSVCAWLRKDGDVGDACHGWGFTTTMNMLTDWK